MAVDLKVLVRSLIAKTMPVVVETLAEIFRFCERKTYPRKLDIMIHCHYLYYIHYSLSSTMSLARNWIISNNLS